MPAPSPVGAGVEERGVTGGGAEGEVPHPKMLDDEPRTIALMKSRRSIGWETVAACRYSRRMRTSSDKGRAQTRGPREKTASRENDDPHNALRRTKNAAGAPNSRKSSAGRRRTGTRRFRYGPLRPRDEIEEKLRREL